MTAADCFDKCSGDKAVSTDKSALDYAKESHEDWFFEGATGQEK